MILIKSLILVGCAWQVNLYFRKKKDKTLDKEVILVGRSQGINRIESRRQKYSLLKGTGIPLSTFIY